MAAIAISDSASRRRAPGDDKRTKPLDVATYAGRLTEEFPGWAASMKALGRHENVYVKVGGLGQAINGLGFITGSLEVCGRDLPHSARSPNALVEQSRWAWSGRSLR